MQKSQALHYHSNKYKMIFIFSWKYLDFSAFNTYNYVYDVLGSLRLNGLCVHNSFQC